MHGPTLSPDRDGHDYLVWRMRFGNPNAAEGEPGADPDSDGQSNTQEFLAGTDPLNGASLFAPMLAAVGANFSLTAALPANRSFQIETSTDLATWSLWDVPGNNGLATPGIPVNIAGPRVGERQFFRFLLREN